MKKHVLLMTLLALTGSSLFADCGNRDQCLELCPPDPCKCQPISHTFFFIRPEYQAGTPERTSLWRDRMLARNDGRNGAIEFVPFGGKSTHAGDIASYFMFNNQVTLSVGGQPAAFDITGENLNIYTRGICTEIRASTNSCFESLFSIAPTRSVIGVGLTYRQGFARKDDGRGFFIEASVPFMRVKNNVNLCEDMINNGDGAVITSAPDAIAPDGASYPPVGSVKEAFEQPAWKYGRIVSSNEHCNEYTKTGLADLDLLIGYDTVHKEKYFFSSHAGVLVPTGNRVKGELLFEPIIGHNHHVFIRYGGEFGAELWHDEEKERSLCFSFQSEFFFGLKNTQVRSFDLKNIPWSRYMQMFNSNQQALMAAQNNNLFLHTPGINLLTRDVEVNPGTARTYQSAFTFSSKSCVIEGGYTFYARPDECVKLSCCFPDGIAIKSIAASEAGSTDIYNTIGTLLGSNVATEVQGYSANIITEDDIDIQSAAHPAIVSYIVYGTIGKRFDNRNIPVMVSFGGSYEFSPEDNSGLNRWLLWGKCAVSF